MIAKIPSLEHFPGYAPGVRVPLMNPEGNGSSGIMLMGEALGDKEAADRLPFRPYAEAGSVLDQLQS